MLSKCNRARWLPSFISWGRSGKRLVWVRLTYLNQLSEHSTFEVPNERRSVFDAVRQRRLFSTRSWLPKVIRRRERKKCQWHFVEMSSIHKKLVSLPGMKLAAYTKTTRIQRQQPCDLRRANKFYTINLNKTACMFANTVDRGVFHHRESLQTGYDLPPLPCRVCSGTTLVALVCIGIKHVTTREINYRANLKVAVLTIL